MLSQEYDQNGGVYRLGDYAYVARTKSIQDVYDELNTSIKQTSHSERYQTLKQDLDADPEVDELTGHSLGGSVLLEARSNCD